MIVLAWLALALFFGFALCREFKAAPEMWVCHCCNNEVYGLESCPYCGTKKEE